MSELSVPSNAPSFSLRPIAWWLTLAGIIAFGEGVGFLLSTQGADTAALMIRFLGRAMALGWLGFGLWNWMEIPIVSRFGVYFVLSLVAAVLWTISRAMGWSGAASAIQAAYILAAMFILGLVVIRFLLSAGWPALGVARTLIDEAIRTKIAVVFVVGLLLVVPALPSLLDPGEFLQYRIQSFLTWSLVLTSTLIGMMTIFLAVQTITHEIQTKRIFLTMTKPVGAASYLFGKWLGIALLNAVLISVFGMGVYFFATSLASEALTMSPMNDQRIAVEERVMVARQANNPILAGDGEWQMLVQEKIEELRAENPAAYRNITAGVRDTVEHELRREWYRLGPRTMRSYQFVNLLPAKERDTMVQLRLSPRIGGETYDDRVQLALRVNGRPVPTQRMSDRTTHIVNIPTTLIDDEGRLLVQIGNPPVTVGNPPQGMVDQPTVSFDVEDGIQMLYRVDSFAMNLFRAMLLIWLMTLFLAAVGLTMGTYLSYPVACVFCLMVYVAAMGSTFIYESMLYYAMSPPPGTLWDTIIWYPSHFFALLSQGEIFEGLKIIIELIGRGFMLMVPDFAGYNPVSKINDGLLISWMELGRATLWVGLIATGIVGVIGYVIFRGKELAQVTV